MENQNNDNESRFSLPPALLRYLPDSELEVVSWHESTLTLKIRKEIGLLTFTQVSHVNLPSKLGLTGIQLAATDEIPASFFTLHRPADQQLDSDERLFVVLGSWGERYFVVAGDIEYHIME